MQKIIFIFSFILFANFSFAQINLVPNPSFEDTVYCPLGSGQINDALNWYNAGGSPDYFNPCANAGGYVNGVPDNFAGNQNAYDGSSFAGIITYYLPNFPNYREDLGVQLTQNLVIGTKYFVSALVSRGDTIFGGDTIKCSSDNIGFRFTTSPFFPWPADNFSHIYSNTIINEAINWQRINGSFIADSAYQYLLIGNFFDDASTNISQIFNSQYQHAYYYVDMVCVSTDSLFCNTSNGIGNFETEEFIIFPNPVSEFLYLNHLLSQTKFIMFDICGKIASEGELGSTNNYIDVSHIQNGIYFLRLNNGPQYKISIIH